MNKLSLTIILFCIVFSVKSQEIDFTAEECEWIENHPVIEFGYEPKWEPYEIYDNGEYIGIVGEYVNKIEDATGIDMQPIPNITWQESLSGLKQGKIHVVPSCGITPERKKYLEFTDVYISDPLIITTRKDYEFVGCLEDLYGKTVVVPEEYYTLELISRDHPYIKIIQAKSIKKCLEKVSYGEADAFVGSLGVVSYYINHEGFTNLKIAAPTEYPGTEIALAVTKDWVIFRDIAQKVFDNVSIQERSQIRKNWISVRYEHGLISKKVIGYLSLFVIIVMIGFIVFFIWNRSLKKQIILRKKTEERLLKSLERIQQQDQDKKMLLQEIHHRVKNNLQIISSMIRLQANNSDNENIASSLKEAVDRIGAIALIHEKVYSTDSLGDISTEDYISSLGREIIRNFGTNEDLDFEVSAEDISLNLKTTVPIALILNELITNSLKYGLQGTQKGKISVNLSIENNQLKMRYFDNGTWVDNPKSKKFGTSLISIFTEQLEGSYELLKSESGTTYLFEFKNY